MYLNEVMHQDKVCVCVCVCPWIFMNFILVATYYPLSFSSKFHKDYYILTNRQIKILKHIQTVHVGVFASWPKDFIVKLQVLGLGLGVDFTFAWDNNNNNDNHNIHKNNKNPHLNFWKGTTLGDKEQGVGIKDKG